MTHSLRYLRNPLRRLLPTRNSLLTITVVFLFLVYGGLGLEGDERNISISTLC